MFIATYNEIQQYAESTYGFVPHTCWIAEAKELCQIRPKREAAYRLGKERVKSNCCPKTKIDPIKYSLRHFEMILNVYPQSQTFQP
jgi:hypothetical protein